MATDSFLAAMTNVRASQRRKDIMRSARWPPVGLATGVTWPDLRYCRTECGIDAAAMRATTCTNKLLSPASSPKSNQCSARMLKGPGSLSLGIRRKVFGMSSATWDKKRFDTGVCGAAAGSRSAGHRLLISCTIC